MVGSEMVFQQQGLHHGDLLIGKISASNQSPGDNWSSSLLGYQLWHTNQKIGFSGFKASSIKIR